MEWLKEATLLRRIRSGDETAFVETYELFGPKIYRHALFRTSSPETADDIMSETFVRAWETIRVKAAEIQRLRAFLYRVADNLIIDHYRRNARSAVSMTDEIEESLQAPGDPHAEIDRLLRSERLAQELAQMRPEVRDLLVMRYVDDLSIEEIASVTGKKKNAVYVALHRAVKELKLACPAIPEN
ncbi:MAG: RNA polymerase sigma factor [Patescibacteria group bacterium]|jgi:RNA polymerase sigma-70 factor (ECF subfamily)